MTLLLDIHKEERKIGIQHPRLNHGRVFYADWTDFYGRKLKESNENLNIAIVYDPLNGSRIVFPKSMPFELTVDVYARG